MIYIHCGFKYHDKKTLYSFSDKMARLLENGVEVLPWEEYLARLQHLG